MTKAEAISTTKQKHLNDCEKLSGMLSEAFALADILYGDYFAKGMNGSGDKELVEADFDTRSYVLADHTGFINMIAQLRNFAGNQPVIQGDYQTINRRMQP